MFTASSARRTWSAALSASEYTATVASPSSRQERMSRTAISPGSRQAPYAAGPSVGESDDVLTSLHEILVVDEEALHHPG